MRGELLLAFVVICFLSLAQCKVQKCKSCTSDSLSDPNPACEADFDEDKVPSVTCGEEYGNQFCFVLMTKNKAGDQREMWNRGCCNQKDGSITCPIGEPDHENNEVYELYRAKCETDDCNTMDPRTENGGGGNNNGGIIVHGRNNGVSRAGVSKMLALIAPFILYVGLL